MNTIFLIVYFLLFIGCTTHTSSHKETDNTTQMSIPQKAPLVEEQKESHLKTFQHSFENSPKVKKYCSKIDRYFKKYRWGPSHCEKFSWHHVRSSHWGTPITWSTFGDERLHKEQPKNATIIFCGVHGDEITPIKFCFDIMKDLMENPGLIGDNLVVIAPVVSPDSFFKKYPTRTNGRGVDVNRNFPTKDWYANAQQIWKKRYRKNKRRNPGPKPMSEQETIFQVNLIKRYKPDKIISVHAPLTLIDYDGPTHKHGKETGGQQLLIQMSDKAGKYKMNDYPFFTGSLGNWAGNERNIPTYTLELPNTDWTKTKKFYKIFRLAIHHAIEHKLSTEYNDKKITTHKKGHEKRADKVL